jgi:threonine synthase
MSLYFNAVVCLECGHEMPADPMLSACPKCGSGWVDARYDYEKVAGLWPAALQQRAHSLWRYRELLPLSEPDPEISMGEGYTALIRLYQYERLFNHPHIYIKDERQGPTSSFKDRQAALAVTAMRRAGITECVLASTGNAGAAYAAYCARAGIKLWLFLTSLVPAEKLREATLYGAEVVRVSGTYDEAKRVASEFAARRHLHLDGGAKAVPGKESMKTLAYEIAEQLGLILRGPGQFAVPDWYIQAVSGGIGPLGVWKGFSELKRMGFIDRMPRLGIVQAAGCAPMVRALAAGEAKAAPVVPNTLITVLATGDPGFSYVQLREAVLSNKGAMLAIDDGDTFAAMRKLASQAGIAVEPATAVAFAGLEKMISQGTIAPGETVVVNCSGHTFPAESHILGDQYILNLDLKRPNRQEEGLSAALENLDEQVTTILVVDDNLNDRRLIRRLLQRYKSYRVYEAHNGTEALAVAQEHKPDLIVTDLTMPDMDGFSLLQQLKAAPDMAGTPVIVVSAKTLSPDDRRRLEAQATSFWTKGGFDTHQLVEHVVRTLGHEPTTLQPHDAARPVTIASPISLSDDEQNAADLPTVVIIEDNPQDLQLARRYLKATGSYHVIGAQTGRDGLKAVYEHRPELVLLDLMLPDMDGMDVLAVLKSDHNLFDIPVVIMSAKELSDEETRSLEKQIYSILRKSSLDRDKFASIIENVLT